MYRPPPATKRINSTASATRRVVQYGASDAAPEASHRARLSRVAWPSSRKQDSSRGLQAIADDDGLEARERHWSPKPVRHTRGSVRRNSAPKERWTEPMPREPPA